MMPKLIKTLQVLMCLAALPLGIQAAEDKPLEKKTAEDKALQLLKPRPP